MSKVAEELVSLLKSKDLTLCTAESFTGGTIAQKIVSVSGASNVFYEGIVCYNTLSKIRRLGVSQATVDEFGVVSEQVALQMVNGLIGQGNCDVAIASTGYADKNSDNRQIGLCYLAVKVKDFSRVYKYTFTGDRKSIMEQASEIALTNAFNILKNKE